MQNATPEGRFNSAGSPKRDNNVSLTREPLNVEKLVSGFPVEAQGDTESSLTSTDLNTQSDSKNLDTRPISRQLEAVSVRINAANHDQLNTKQTSEFQKQVPQQINLAQPIPDDSSHADSEYDYLSRAAIEASNRGELLVEFRRGADNSHVNRMVEGSYSRFLTSANYMSKPTLFSSFYGETPAYGLVPRKSFYSKNEESNTPSRHTAFECSIHHDRFNTQNGSARSNKNMRSGSLNIPNNSHLTHKSRSQSTRKTHRRCIGNVPYAYRDVSPILRRDKALLGSDVYQSLCKTQTRLRQSPLGTRAGGDPDHIYYNHKSKGFFVPHQPPGDSLLLQYNHLYDYGDGTRMKPICQDGENTLKKFRLNPHAKPPCTYAESKGSSWRYYNITDSKNDKSKSQRRSLTNTKNFGRGNLTFSPRNIPYVSSLRTAKALDVQKLHVSPFQNAPSIEEVMMQNPDTVNRLSEEVHKAINQGRLHPKELPQRIGDQILTTTDARCIGEAALKPPSRSNSRRSKYAATYAGNVSSAQTLSSRGNGDQRCAFTDRPADGLLRFVVGQGSTRFPTLQPPRTPNSSIWMNESKGNLATALNNTELPQVGAMNDHVHTNGDKKPYSVSRLHMHPT
ncbi:unnamed protein product [Phytomonas sp. Hart1]|nr:unnamed protein product [Phytomonas sp. Hart1]|eukprot:CCW66805.1 unnamed protein product [Phytomonas sp. isolate Hart1]